MEKQSITCKSNGTINSYLEQCNNECTEEGESSKAVQCEICYSWVHAVHDGLSSEDYKLAFRLATYLPLLSSINQLMYILFGSPDLDQALKLITVDQTKLQELVEKLFSHANDLSQQNRGLQMEIDTISDSHFSNLASIHPPVSPSTSAFSILKNWQIERRKSTIIFLRCLTVNLIKILL